MWLEDEGTFEDQFGTEQDCTFVRQQVVVQQVDTRTRKGGYDQTVRTFVYEDPLGRRFTKTNDGIGVWQGRTYTIVGEDPNGDWKEAEKLDRKAPYISPDGRNKVEVMDEDHESGYEFYEDVQTELL